MSRSVRAGTGSRSRRLFVRVLQLGATVLVTWFILDRLGLSLSEVRDLDPRWWRPQAGPLVLSSLLLAAAYALSGALWGGMVRELGGGGLGHRRGIGIYLVANLGRYVPGKVWQILGLAWLAGRAGVPPTVATSAAVLGQALSLAGAALVGAVALFGADGAERRLAPWVLGAVALGILLTLSRSFMEKALALWSRVLRARETPQVPGPTFGLRWAAAYALNWIAYGAAFVVFASAFGVDVPWVPTASGFVASWLLGYLALFAPAGIGVREGVLVALLSPFLGAGAVAVAALSRVWLTLVEVAATLVLGGGVLREARAVTGEGS